MLGAAEGARVVGPHAVLDALAEYGPGRHHAHVHLMRIAVRLAVVDHQADLVVANPIGGEHGRFAVLGQGALAAAGPCDELPSVA